MTEPPSIPVAVSGRPAIEVARECAREAGGLVRSRFRQTQQVSVKGRGNLVTETDLAAEQILTSALAREFPEHRVLAEETATDTDHAGWVWVLDPLDGTHNFVNGIPFFCVNVALCHDGDPVVAVTHDPIHEETFWAALGAGAGVNDGLIEASKAALDGVIVGVDLGYAERARQQALQLANQILPAVEKIRIPGSAALGLAYAACGRYGLFVHHHLFPWDIAAGILLVREAGGVITERDGRSVGLRSRTVLAGGSEAHEGFLRWQEAHSTELEPLAEA